MNPAIPLNLLRILPTSLKSSAHFPASAPTFMRKILNQYAAIRARKPSCVVETGNADGVSSSYFLPALRKNGKGKLHSIDLADATSCQKPSHL
jgi:hypothetical protein